MLCTGQPSGIIETTACGNTSLLQGDLDCSQCGPEWGLCPDPDAPGYDFCVELTVDPQNCGTCGTACGPGTSCQGGSCLELCPGGVCDSYVCASSCPAGEMPCGADAGVSPYCTDTSRDAQNCGECGNACDTGASCTNSVCQPVPPPCGFGSNPPACPAGYSCLAGGCYTTCPAGFGSCDYQGAATCFDLQTDDANCGSCGHECDPAAGQGCANGVCVNFCLSSIGGECPGIDPDGGHDCSRCGEAYTDCGSTCSILSTDDFNCGSCGNACGPGAACIQGVCTPSCAAGAVCSSLLCVSACPAGQIPCGGSATNTATCVDSSYDANNCGGCGVVCSSGLCQRGSCVSPCDAGP